MRFKRQGLSEEGVAFAREGSHFILLMQRGALVVMLVVGFLIGWVSGWNDSPRNKEGGADVRDGAEKH